MTSTVVSLSEVSTFQTCEQQWLYGYYFGYRSITPSYAIKAGVEGHKMLENFYKNFRDTDNIKQATDYMYEMLPADKKTPPVVRAFMLVKNYIDTEFAAEAKDYESLHVEKKFFVPVSDNLIMALQPDLTKVYKKRRKLLEDYKFTGKAWSQKQLTQHKQLDVYDALLEDAGEPVDRSLLRFFNHETMKMTVFNKPVNRERRDRIKKHVIRVAERIAKIKRLSPEEIRERVSPTMNYMTCKFCPFVFPCSLELEGKSAEKTFQMEYTKEHGYGYTIANN
jgi:hypothetical protein